MIVYVLAKSTKGCGIEGIYAATEDEKVVDIWEAAGHPVYVIDTTFLPTSHSYEARYPDKDVEETNEHEAVVEPTKS